MKRRTRKGVKMKKLALVSVILSFCIFSSCGGSDTPTSPSPIKKALVVQIHGISNGHSCGDQVRGRAVIEIKYSYTAEVSVLPRPVLEGADFFLQASIEKPLPPAENRVRYLSVSCPVSQGKSTCSAMGYHDLANIVTKTIGVSLVDPDSGEVFDRKEIPCELTWLIDP